MPRKRTYPGSIYVNRGKIIIKFRGKKYHTRLNPTTRGFQAAEDMLKKLWYDSHNLNNNPLQAINIKDAFSEFLAFKMNRMEKTIKMYNLAYKAIIRGNYVLDADTIEKDIQHYLQTTNHNNITINTYLNYLQIFLNFCAKKYWIPQTTFMADYKKNNNKIINEPWTENEIFLLTSYFDYENTCISLLISFMLETGARMIDALTLTKEQIDYRKKIITWNNKITKKPEPRPISDIALQILKNLPNLFPYRYSGSSYLSKKLRWACEDLEIDRRGRSYQEFRVTFRMRLLERGVPKEYVMWLLRHHSEHVTDEHYTHFDTEKVRTILNEKQAPNY